jgi:hypothetical protein
MKDRLGDAPYNLYGGEPPSQKHSRTSRDAAASIKRHIGPSHRRILAWLDAHPSGGSDERIAADLGMTQNTFRPRRRELQMMEYVCDSGRTELTHSRRDAVIWVRATVA